MKFFQLIKQSFIAIFRNKGRSFLTVLGIIIGIGSVIALISLGTGVRANVTKSISALGTTTVTVTPGQVPGAGGGLGGRQATGGGTKGGSTFRNAGQSTLTQADLDSLSDTPKHPLVKYISGQVAGSTILKVNGADQRYSVLGTSEQFFLPRGYNISSGVNFTKADVTDKSQVAILGQTLATDVFGAAPPVGQSISINSENYKVIGLLQKADQSNFNDPNTQVYIPYTTAMTAFDTTTFSDFTIEAKSENDVNALKDDIETTLLANHNITDKKLADFSVLTSADLLSTINNVTGLLTSLLAGIAAISLIVGGIGIMNIMLVSVTERTREIGLRKAVGAKTSDILIQFVIEAVLLTVIGGALGIGLGVLIGRIASRFIGFDAVVTMSAVLLAVGVSSAIGLVFGIYPAAKAARLNPIDALRYE